MNGQFANCTLSTISGNMRGMFKTIDWTEAGIVMLDQRLRRRPTPSATW
jgi:hypothetical protein